MQHEDAAICPLRDWMRMEQREYIAAVGRSLCALCVYMLIVCCLPNKKRALPKTEFERLEPKQKSNLERLEPNVFGEMGALDSERLEYPTGRTELMTLYCACLLYTSDAADE